MKPDKAFEMKFTCDLSIAAIYDAQNIIWNNLGLKKSLFSSVKYVVKASNDNLESLDTIINHKWPTINLSYEIEFEYGFKIDEWTLTGYLDDKECTVWSPGA